MKIKDLLETVSGEILCGATHIDMEVVYGFSSDMMSDVLTLLEDDIL